MTLTTPAFRIPRTILARLSAEVYVRMFWWFILVPPLFGALALYLGAGLMQVIGIFGIMWPLTIPARAVLGGWKAGTFFSQGVSLEARDGILYFHGADGRGMKLALSSIRKVEERHGYVLLIFGIGNFVAIPSAALGDEKSELMEAGIMSEKLASDEADK
ncbi:MAG TPA: hypothetical protein VG944_11370 [Fimbriimonas sp.]|nr:hypothetical protein [Fimbriimonas sp.]